MKKANQSTSNPKQRIEHLNKTKPWVYLMIIAIFILIDTCILFLEYEDSYHGQIETSFVITVIGMSIACCIIFIAYWNIIIEMQKTRHKRLLVEEEITTIPNELELDIDKNLIKLSYKYLDQYYLQTREHAQKGFIVTVTVSICGAIIIAVGLISMFLGKTNPAYVTTASGVIVEFISAIYFYLYNKTVQGMNSYHKKLVLSQNIALALKLSNSLEENKEDAKINIINELIKDVNIHMEQ